MNLPVNSSEMPLVQRFPVFEFRSLLGKWIHMGVCYANIAWKMALSRVVGGGGVWNIFTAGVMLKRTVVNLCFQNDPSLSQP